MILRELVTKLGFEVNDREFKGVENRIGKLQDGFIKMGAAATAALTATIVPAARLERTLKDAVIASGATGDAFTKMEEELRTKSLRLSEELGFSAQQIAGGFFDVISTGTQAGTEGFDQLATTGLKFAKAAGLETGQAIDRLSTASKIFFENVGEANKVADAFFKANTLGQTTVAQLTEAMRDAGPAAAQTGTSLADTTAVLTGLADAGFKGTLGGTAFRQIMLKLAAPVEKGAETLKKFGIETQNADGTVRNILDILEDMQVAFEGVTEAETNAALKAIAGEEAFSRLGALLNSDINTLRDWSQQLENSGGTLDAAFNEIMKATTEQFGLLINAVTNLAATIGAPLLGPTGRVLAMMVKVIKSTREFIEANKAIFDPLFRVIGVVFAVVAVLGALAAVSKVVGFLFSGVLIKALWGMIAPTAILAAKALLLIGTLLIFEDIMSAILGGDSLFGDLVDWLDKTAEKMILAGDSTGYWVAGLKTAMELLIVIPRLIGDAAAMLGSFAGAVASGDFSQLGDAIMDRANSENSGFATLNRFMSGQGVTPTSVQRSSQQNNNVNVEVNVPEGSNPEETAEAVRKGTMTALEDLLRQSENELTPTVVQ